MLWALTSTRISMLTHIGRAAWCVTNPWGLQAFPQRMGPQGGQKALTGCFLLLFHYFIPCHLLMCLTVRMACCHEGRPSPICPCISKSEELCTGLLAGENRALEAEEPPRVGLWRQRNPLESAKS